MSIIPTIPAAFLTTAETPIYSGYDHGPRLWGFDVVYDQQVAGVVMKVVTGFYLWVIIAVIFFRWALRETGPTRRSSAASSSSRSRPRRSGSSARHDGSEAVTYEQ